MTINNQEPRLIRIDNFYVAGLSVRTINRDEFNPATARLPALWQRFFTAGFVDNIPEQTPGSPIFGVYSDYESNATGHYTVTAGVKSELQSTTPMHSTITIPSGDYLVFENQGMIPQIVVETWQRIWTYFESQEKYIRHFNTDFEMYKSDGHIAIYIGV